MINIKDKTKCSGCHACYNSCPSHCISMNKDEEGFLYPAIDQKECLNCGLCEKVCPFLDSRKRSEPTEAWAAKCTDEKLRFESSSGGIFSLLAIKVLNSGGIVFGAAFSADFKEVYHTSVTHCEDLKKLRTSKYVQSAIGESYREVKELLDEGKDVLFSGVPCQITGLKKYLKKEYDNLVCVDVICHGVPSPELWKKYLDCIEKKHRGVITDINFRHKKISWQNFGISRTSDGVDIFTPAGSDPYMQMFLRNYALRPSCFACQTKTNGSDSDITLGDFWGIDCVLPKMNDGKGVSAVIVHTEKGKRLYNAIAECIEQQAVPYDSVKKYNSPIFQSVAKPEERDLFFMDLNRLSFDELAEKYCKPLRKSVKQRLAGTKLWKKLRLLIRGGG